MIAPDIQNISNTVQRQKHLNDLNRMLHRNKSTSLLSREKDNTASIRGWVKVRQS